MEKPKTLLERLRFAFALVLAYLGIITRARLVRALVAGTAALELVKGETRHLAPISNLQGDPLMFGPVTVEGNGLPTFTYLIHDDHRMEFIRVMAFVGLPNLISFRAVIDAPARAEDHLREVEVQPAYKKPFFRLARALHGYFPLLPEGKEAARVLGF